MIGFLVFLGTIFLIVFPVILLSMVSGLKGQIETLNRRIMLLSQDLKNMTKSATATEVKTETEPLSAVTSYATTDHSAYMPKESVVADSLPELEAIPHVQELFPDKVDVLVTGPVTEFTVAPEQILTEEPAVPEKPAKPEKPILPAYTSPPKPRPKEVFNFERFIGENLINKIGIGVLVIGIGLFVKYAIDNNWLNETGRVVIGFMSGGVLLALAYRFHKAYRAFSSVLTGGAMVVFYFTVAIAFREYHLFGQTASFLMMVAITTFSVWLSILYNRRELAVLSLIGGMLTPFMVSRGDGNYHVLFTYIAILNIGMLALSLRKQWKELLIISFIGTQLIFWLYYLQTGFFKSSTNDIARDTALLLYASVFYIIFLLMPLIQVFRDKERSKDHALHIIMLVANSFFHLLASVLLLQRMDAGSYKGLLAALLAVLNGAVAALLYNNKKDKTLFHLFAGLTISYVTLAAPMQFEGNNISLFWATEALLLLFLFRKSNTVIYYAGSLILFALAFISIMTLHNLQWTTYDYESHIRAMEGSIIVNRFFITRLYVSLAFVVSGLLLRDHYSERIEQKQVIPSWLPTTIGVVAAVLLFYTGNRELYMFTHTDYTSIWKMAYFLIFTCVLSVITGQTAATCRFCFFTAIALWVVGCLYFWFNNCYISLDHKVYAFLLYWIGFAGLCGLFVNMARIYFKQYQFKTPSGKIMMYFFNLAAIISISIATIEAINQITLHNDLYISNKIAITVLWTLCAFVQMWLGMHIKYKTLRIISLSLLGLVLCKLFMYDLINVSQGAKIIAFVVLGVVLLVLSFLYQKLKKILFEEE